MKIVWKINSVDSFGVSSWTCKIDCWLKWKSTVYIYNYRLVKLESRIFIVNYNVSVETTFVSTMQ